MQICRAFFLRVGEGDRPGWWSVFPTVSVSHFAQSSKIGRETKGFDAPGSTLSARVPEGQKLKMVG